MPNNQFPMWGLWRDLCPRGKDGVTSVKLTNKYKCIDFLKRSELDQ